MWSIEIPDWLVISEAPRSVSRVIPNPSAIATPVAALIRANWVAATRRPVPSPASHANTNSPRT